MRLIPLFLLFFGTYTSIPAWAEAPSFGFPLHCTYGKDCWVMNYTDVGPPGDGAAKDTACLSRTYDGHKGVDFAIRDGRAMKGGVAVLAAAEGTVTRVRDKEEDRWTTPKQREEIRTAKKECGNAVLIDHGGGWQTMYCHLKNGSLAVKSGQRVKKGDKIAEVGLSGDTQFPHLHFGISNKDKIIDPFTGLSSDEACGKPGTPLWDNKADLKYDPVSIVRHGFDTKVPTLHKLERGQDDPPLLHAKLSPSLVYYAVFYGAREKDRIDLTIYNPQGKFFAQETRMQEKSRARQMYYVGRKTDQVLMQKGTYKGEITITRTHADGTKQSWSETDTIEVR